MPAKRQKVSKKSKVTITSDQNKIPVTVSDTKKESPHNPVAVKSLCNVQPVVPQLPVISTTTSVCKTTTSDASSSNEISFTCVSCQFQTLNYRQFMKHNETHNTTPKPNHSLIPIIPPSNSNDCSKNKSLVKRFRCGFCIKKLCNLQEVIRHVESLHYVRDVCQYFYYYSPDFEFTDDDKKYECSYCKYGKETLSSLKIHCALVHPESPFKVRGFVKREVK